MPTNTIASRTPKRILLPAYLLLPACLLLVAACTASAQTLARPGWNGSGFNADPWWKHAIFYQLDPQPAKEIVGKLDALQSLGIDALLLPAQDATASDSEAFDELIRQASRRNLRVLLTLQASSANADLAATARLWLSRGASGFRVVTPPGRITRPSCRPCASLPAARSADASSSRTSMPAPALSQRRRICSPETQEPKTPPRSATL